MRAHLFVVVVVALALGCSKKDEAETKKDPPADNANKNAPPDQAKPNEDRDGPKRPKDGEASEARIRQMKIAATDGLREFRFVVEGVEKLMTQDELAAVTPLVVEGDQGGAVRIYFNLRELANIMGGKTARVVAVSGEDGNVAIDAKAWDDNTRKPVLRMNRRGSFKFQYMGEDGKPIPDSDVRDVVSVVIQK